MTFAIGIFDLFAYAIPGSLYLGLFGYLATRLHWIDAAAAGRTPVVLLIIAVVLLSYLLGFLAYPVGALADRLAPRWYRHDPRETFLRREPALRNREFVRVHGFLLLSAVELHDREAAMDVSRLRASGLMLRNCSAPLLLGAVAAIVELIVGGHRWFAAVSAVLLVAASGGTISQGRKLRRWAQSKTLELAAWIPDIDERIRVMRGEGPAVKDAHGD
ncbi:hypothetical protein [Amycolatopsis anabasis]|uniref:hypothetical protein n=1 Tax=Amycolatopsis anabasis TaxID=1840409 RepID=UPI00131C0E2F|nr:hypothetical protein [Amycolatopsis anabasis]